MTHLQTLKKELARMLQWEEAHVGFATAVENLSLNAVGHTVASLPYTVWQLVEHLRIAQHDIVSFCLDDNYQERTWPDDYWPTEKAPVDQQQWEKSLKQIQQDRQRIIKVILLEDTDLFKPIARGNGQHLFREAMLIADHEAYHTGQIVLIRKQLGNWDM